MLHVDLVVSLGTLVSLIVAAWRISAVLTRQTLSVENLSTQVKANGAEILRLRARMDAHLERH